MEFVSGHTGREHDIHELFRQTFAASEGANESDVIGSFVDDLMKRTPENDLFAFFAYEKDTLVGGVFFSRLNYQQDSRTVFILSPMAVNTNRQKRGIGQRLIAYGLDELRKKGVDVAVTYGDINFYSRIGFRQISEEQAKAPLKLSFPEGWLAQSLTEDDWKPFIGLPTCVEALNKSELW